MLKKLPLLVALSISVLVLVSAYAELNDGQDRDQQIRTDSVGTQTGELTASDPEVGILKLSASDTTTIAAENEGKITLYGGEYILKFSPGDLNAFEEEAKSRLGNLGEFGKYFFGDSANGEAVVYLDVNDTILLAYQNEKGALALIVSNDEEKERAFREYSLSVLDSQEKLLFESVVEGLFNDNDQDVYIPQDASPYDNAPVPKLIVQKQKGIAARYFRADGFDFISFGFPSAEKSAEDNMQEIIDLNGAFQPSGDGTLQASSYDGSQPDGGGSSQPDGEGPIPPVPELSTMVLLSAGLFGILLVSRIYRRN